MTSILGKIAVSGLAVGVVSLSLAWALGGHDLWHTLADGRFPTRSCSDSKVAVGGPERRLPWTGRDSIGIALSVPVRLVPGSGSDVVLRGAPETIAHLQLNDGGLRADCRSLRSAQAVTLELPAQALRTVKLSGAATVTIEKLGQPELALVVSGSGRVQAQGAVERVAVTLSGSGDVRLGEVALKRLTAKISGSGSLEAAPRDEADLTLSGSGQVRLLTRPAALRSKVSGSGRVEQPPVESADRK
ncbi:MAG TPA: DUF2807 domain-containing protein [Reyranella sp.]|nr:DUF2807 domain-containing protein [Reyranella sp.]